MYLLAFIFLQGRYWLRIGGMTEKNESTGVRTRLGGHTAGNFWLERMECNQIAYHLQNLAVSPKFFS